MRRKAIVKKSKYDLVGEIIDFETSGLEPKREKKLFQTLVNTGQAWSLQGMYGRRANAMLEKGIIKLPKKRYDKMKGRAGQSLMPSGL